MGWVKLGMYVADLDRPWLGTPFMMQGFRVSTPRQIEVLAQYCQHVIVEADASLPEVVPLVLERGELVAVEVDATPPVDGEAARIRPPAPAKESGASSRDANRAPTGPKPAATKPDTPAAGSKAAPRASRARGFAAAIPTGQGSSARGAPWPRRVRPVSSGPSNASSPAKAH